MATKQTEEQYTDKEAQQRFQKLVGLALKSPPKPIKSMPKKGVPAQSKKKKKATAY